MKGQALAETVIITPILIFLLIGVFEVGWILRSYLILTNANREAARFAVRQNYLNFNSNDIGYEQVWTHTLDSISGQIPFDESTGAMIISYITIDAPCTMPYTITTPLDVPTYTWKYPTISTYQTRIDYVQLSSDLLLYQIEHSCDVIAQSLAVHPNNLVIIEIWYQHKQLFGFPLISNPLTDPVELYGHTIFRKAPDSRQ